MEEEEVKLALSTQTGAVQKAFLCYSILLISEAYFLQDVISGNAV
jgi:hypothetical protein